ncbi:MAG TPA: glucose 1-dehydrogenase [Streptosporangiaceae bacterium]|nr:glucose 1-dehydrogenase [Streptosporangiaceae bacterium]
MNTLEGRVALVTGGSKGIGRAISRSLAEAGASVAVNYASDEEAAKRTVAEIQDSGGRAMTARADKSHAEEVRRMFAEVNEAFGVVDIVVDNAAVYTFQPFEDITETEFRRQFDINVLGSILVAQEYLRQVSPDGGSIISILTAGISTNYPRSALYTSTKSALMTLTRVLAKEVADRKIRVNAIAPGATDTEGARAVRQSGGSVDARLVAAIPLGRRGTPEDIAPVAVFLASDDAKWITGDVIYASGGQY